MEPLGYYKWHWQAWRANRRVQRMPWEAKGLYRELLDEFWVEGSLPNELDELADICGLSPKEFCQWWEYIAPCFEERDGRLYNAKMDEQRTSIDKARVAMAQGGAEGGKASNSSTRAKATQAYPKPTLNPAKAQPDIEEKRREEKSKEEKKPSRAKRESPTGEAKKAMHGFLRERIFAYYRAKNDGADPAWDGSEGMAVDKLLSACPSYTIDDWNKLLRGRYDSDVNHAERPRLWIANLPSYRNAVNAFKQPKENEDGTPRNYRNPTKSEITMAAAQNAARFDSEAASDPSNSATGYAPGAGIFDLLSGIGRVPDSGSVGSNRAALPPGRADGQDFYAEPWIDGDSVPVGQQAPPRG